MLLEFKSWYDEVPRDAWWAYRIRVKRAHDAGLVGSVTGAPPRLRSRGIIRSSPQRKSRRAAEQRVSDILGNLGNDEKCSLLLLLAAYGIYPVEYNIPEDVQKPAKETR